MIAVKHKMARPNEISKWRRYAMQAIMWVILAGTVGLAALVNVGASMHLTRP